MRGMLREAQNEGQEANLNLKKETKAGPWELLKNLQRQGLCGKTWWICVQLVTN